MTMEAVRRTMRVAPADFFLLSLEDEPVAAALVFYVADGIAGDLLGRPSAHAANKCMNYLAYGWLTITLKRHAGLIDGTSTEKALQLRVMPF